MRIKKAYKFQLKPNAEQYQQMIEIAGGCRFVWNKALKMQCNRLSKTIRKQDRKILHYQELDYFSKLWKRSDEYGFLKLVPAHCLQQKLRDFDRACWDAFDKNQPNKRFPRVKRRGLDDSFRFPEPKHIAIENRRIKLPKLGWIRFRKSQPIVGTIKNVTVSLKAGQWYIAVQVEQEITIPSELPDSSIGIDVGIASFATLSTGKQIAGVNAYRQYEGKLAKAQRKLSRKKKYSKNWRKQQIRIQRIHQKLRNIRRDFLHKCSTVLSKSHAMIAVEDLKISNMSRSAKGTLTDPGKNVKAKSGLNKSLLDQGWGEFRRQLGYKLEWKGGLLVKVAPQNTSLKCFECGCIDKGNRLSQAEFQCLACGHCAHADVNAAKNILAAGHAALACGELGLPGLVKQEPLGTSDQVPA